MIRLTTFAQKRVAVFGLGGSGRACAHALVAGGADVVCWDDGDHGRDAARSEGLSVADLGEADWSGFVALVLSPGVPLTHPEPHWTVAASKAAGVPVIGDFELFFRERAARFPDAPVIAITGTNGKSTTTVLTAHLIASLGFDVQMGGNIGRAVLTLNEPRDTTVYVLEISSYQIDLTPMLNPTVGVMLNVTPDHLDRHGTIEAYADIKARLPREAKLAVVSLDDDWTRDVARGLEASGRLYAFTAGKGAALIPTLYAIGPMLFVHERDGAHASSLEIAALNGIGSLRGAHNVQNALAALSAIRALSDGPMCFDGLLAGKPVWEPGRLGAALQTFPGLAHRLEPVGSVDDVLFVNDSKATNAQAAEMALAAFDGGVHWIAGGVPKAGGIQPLKPLFGRVAQAYLIGEAAGEFAATLDGEVPYVRCGTLDEAVKLAFAAAQAAQYGAQSVVLSPACASFDQYKNFEVRGDAFKALVQALPGFCAPGKTSGGGGAQT